MRKVKIIANSNAYAVRVIRFLETIRENEYSKVNTIRFDGKYDADLANKIVREYISEYKPISNEYACFVNFYGNECTVSFSHR